MKKNLAEQNVLGYYFDMKFANGKISIQYSDLNDLREKGFDVNIHCWEAGNVNGYLNGITTKLCEDEYGGDINIGLHCWADNLEAYIQDDKQQILNEKQFAAFIDLMNAALAFQKSKKNLA